MSVIGVIVAVMSVLGVSARVQSSKFVVGFAVVDGATISTSSHLSAPSANDAISLGELYRMAHDLIGSYEPESDAMPHSREHCSLCPARDSESFAVLALVFEHRDRLWLVGADEVVAHSIQLPTADLVVS